MPKPANMPKKPLKLMEKPTDTSLSKIKKKKKKKNYESFSIYIYKILRSIQTAGNLGISRKAMLIMNNFISDMLEKLGMEAGRFVAHGKMRTLGSREIESAVRLLLPGELGKHANMEGMKAVTLYHQRRGN